MSKRRKRWRKGWRREGEYEERNEKMEEERRKMEGRVSRAIEEWREMVGKRREKRRRE